MNAATLHGLPSLPGPLEQVFGLGSPSGGRGEDPAFVSLRNVEHRLMHGHAREGDTWSPVGPDGLYRAVAFLVGHKEPIDRFKFASGFTYAYSVKVAAEGDSLYGTKIDAKRELVALFFAEPMCREDRDGVLRVLAEGGALHDEGEWLRTPNDQQQTIGTLCSWLRDAPPLDVRELLKDRAGAVTPPRVVEAPRAKDSSGPVFAWNPASADAAARGLTAAEWRAELAATAIALAAAERARVAAYAPAYAEAYAAEVAACEGAGR